jgi:hypothetical protein
MKERNIPPYTGDDYYGLGWPTTFDTLRNDLEGIQQYNPQGLTMIMNGEIGRYRGMRFVEQTNIARGGANDTTAFNAFTNTSDAWNNTKSDWVFFFGDDTVAEAIAVSRRCAARFPAITAGPRVSPGTTWAALVWCTSSTAGRTR